MIDKHKDAQGELDEMLELAYPLQDGAINPELDAAIVDMRAGFRVGYRAALARRASQVSAAAPADKDIDDALFDIDHAAFQGKDSGLKRDRAIVRRALEIFRASEGQAKTSAAVDNWPALLVNVDLAAQRGQFESFAWPKRLNFRKHADQQYVEVDTADAWKGWIAHAAQLADSTAQVSAAAPEGWKYRVLTDKHTTGKVHPDQFQMNGVWGRSSGWMVSIEKPTHAYMIECIPLFRASEGQAQTSAVPIPDQYVGKWSISADEENFSGEFDSEQEAIAEATSRKYEKFWIGQCVHPADLLPDAKSIGESVIEQADEWAYEECGGDDRIFEMNDDDLIKLGQAVRGIIKREASVGRYGVINIKMHQSDAAQLADSTGGVKNG